MKFPSLANGSQMFVKSGVEVANIDTRDLGLYLAFNRPRAQHVDADIANIVPLEEQIKGNQPP